MVVVAGSTEEPLDRVRLLSNRSSGGLGRAMAEEAFARGAEVPMLLGRHQVPPPPYVPVNSFDSVDSLMQATELVPRDAAAVLMAAAVADYRMRAPLRGTLASGKERLDLSLEPAPKVLPLLRSSAPEPTLVAFKLEVGLDDSALERIARERLGRGLEDMVVANDLERVSAEDHPAVIVARGAGAVAFSGTKTHLAAAILDAVEAARG